MSEVALSGANGFLGWHLRSALLESATAARTISLGGSFDLDHATAALSGTSRVIHLAGINRGTDEEVEGGNALFARQFAEALKKADEPPAIVVYANSVQAGNGTVYGEAKLGAADVLRETAQQVGAEFQDIRLPNIFGEHGKPFYNSVTATFCHLLAQGRQPVVEDDKVLTLLHAQDAADLLIGNIAGNDATRLCANKSVSGLLEKLSYMASKYARHEIPDVSTDFDRNLFNTYRSFTFPQCAPIPLTRHADDRGVFFEVIRSHGGKGQTSFSTTIPGVTRGDHFHRRKIERFTVLAGDATISLRRLFDGKVYNFKATGGDPVAVDMPTMWSHNITNTGTDVLYTSFWTNDIFDPDSPDTIVETVNR